MHSTQSAVERGLDPNYVQRDTLRLAFAIAAPMRAKE
jgi:hypothetical protein